MVLDPSIVRNPQAAGGETYDLIVVGGGVYGAMLALESARRGLKSLLVERHDFGGATSWNSHRIVHGGLRYLQRLDLRRFSESVRERRWFLRHFPELVEPLPCLMPLYSEGARRPSILRAVLLANHLLSRHRNEGLRSDRVLQSGGVMTRRETMSLFPGVRREGLRGGALWYDAVLTDSQRLLIETLRWACACGATCLNYVEATALRTDGDGVSGVEAVDRESGAELVFSGSRVVNCAGPWCGEIAGSFDRDVEGLFRPSLAFNILFDREPVSEAALALSAPGAGSRTWFLHNRRGRIYAGTAHHPWDGDAEKPRASREEVDAMIDGINAAAPSLGLRRRQILRIHAGLLPASATGGTDLATQPLIHDHGAHHGPSGLFSVSGVKYTTSRDIAERTLRRVFPDNLAEIDPQGTARPELAALPDVKHVRAATDPDADVDDIRRQLEELVEGEAVVHADDLLLRRTAWGDDPAAAAELAGTLNTLLPRLAR